MMQLLVPLAISAGVIYGVHKYGRVVSGLKGDDAQVGDRVDVPVASLPAGALPPALPAGVGYIVVDAQSVTPTHVNGPITGYVLTLDPRAEVPLNPPIGPVAIPKSTISRVFRGRVVA